MQYSICNYYGDKDTVLYVSSHREKMEAVTIATARRVPNRSTNNVALFQKSHLMQDLESYKVVLLSFWDLSSCVCGCLSLKCLVKTLCFSPPLCFKVELAECAKELYSWVTATSNFHLYNQPSGNAYCCKRT